MTPEQVQSALADLSEGLDDLTDSNSEIDPDQLLERLTKVSTLQAKVQDLEDEVGKKDALIDLLMMESGLNGLLNQQAQQAGDYARQKLYSNAELAAMLELDKLEPMSPLILVKIPEIHAYLAGVESHLDSPAEVVLKHLEQACEGYMNQIEMDPALNDTYYQVISINGLAEAVANQVNLLQELERPQDAKTACTDFLSFAQAVKQSDFADKEGFPDLSDFQSYLEQAG